MRSILVPLLLLAVAAVWLVMRDAQIVEAHEEKKRAAARQAEIDAREVRRLKALQAESAPGIGDRHTRPGKKRRAPVGPEDIEHAHDGLTLMLDHCFADFRQRRPDAVGRLEVSFTLVKNNGYGTVEGIRVLDDPFADRALRKCVEAGPAESFPVPEGNGRIDAKIGLDLAPKPGGAQ